MGQRVRERLPCALHFRLHAKALLFASRARKRQRVRPERRRRGVHPASVLPVSHQRAAARGKLDANLMRSAGIKPHMRKTAPIRFRQYAVGQRRFFDALALF